MRDLILIVNPGSTSTKFGVYSMGKSTCVFEKEIDHPKEELEKFDGLIAQKSFRKDLVLESVKKNGYALDDVAAVVGRGGLLNPKEGGVYRVSEAMLNDLSSFKYGVHASNLGAIIANEIALELKVDSFIADPVTVKEFEPYAYVTGLKGTVRKCRAHVLNLRQVGRMLAEKIGKPFTATAFIGVHLGGGLTVAALRNGRFIDVNNALLGEGPFSPERTGTMPSEDIIDMSFSGQYTKEELKKLLTKKAGLISYLGTSDFREIQKRYEAGDEDAKFYTGAFAYRIAKTIGEMATVFSGKVDGIYITGGIARAKFLMDMITERVSFIAPVHLFPGQYEMTALGRNVHMALKKEIPINEYDG